MESLEEAIYQLVQEHDVNLVTKLRKSYKQHLLRKMEVIDPFCENSGFRILHKELFPEDFENERINSENDSNTQRDGYCNP